MGLAVAVGRLADLNVHDPEGAEWLRESLSKVNEVLAEKGLPQHKEPEQLPSMQSRTAIATYSYSFLHHLRRFYARATNAPDWIPTPTPEGEDPAQDPVLDEEMYMMSSHLLCHSDCEGFYLPIKFDEVIVDREGWRGDLAISNRGVDEKNQGRVFGGLLGSSYRLMDKLLSITPKLGIELDRGRLTDAQAQRIDEDSQSNKGLWIEKTVWLSLFEAARLSIEFKTAICFT
ncbi:conserved hypothetical protein [Hyella patelloides LEGE 07179]|uniref:Uncharacterized protein n=1 Tax=Hyella patelloides LEGE 07179 TaxID=945734 RepID=A0A563VPA6_9CYAN|nr:hypothetical protein [Hyella patelloides]VEP13175.1 conserved hypothetical protein [Hyella patelloides LEGE 07179]